MSNGNHRFWPQMSLLGVFLTLVLLFGTNPVSAQSDQQKSYQYDDIRVYLKVNQDSTIDVEELQTFDFTGNFHAGWRSIPFRMIDSISDVQVLDVIDEKTFKPLDYSPERLDKTDPASWGKYTYYRENGGNIEWYYNLQDTVHSWILKYKIHGAVGFGDPTDRLYWNIFTEYSVPVKQAKVVVELPVGVKNEAVRPFAYRSSGLPADIRMGGDGKAMAFFESSGFAPNEDYTVDLSWPTGFVSKWEYFKDFFRINFGYTLSVIIFVCTLIAGLVFWLVKEKLRKGRGTIVPQYEPPEHLPPAMAELVTKERLTAKGLAATVVDLAVRGYVKIKEDQSGFLSKIFNQKDYVIGKNKEYINDQSLHDYEKGYLNILFFGNSGEFSTKALRRDHVLGREVYGMVEKLKDEIYRETDVDTNAFEVGLELEKKKNIILGIIISIFVFLIFVSPSQPVLLAGTCLACTVGLWAFVKYEARLSAEGRILKEEWLGFKIYLEVAEKDRLQNLVPDLFEKYLPYAMVFGVEKKWAKAFEGMNMAPPAWYSSPAVTSGVYAGVGQHSVSGFSPSGFSASFSSAFTSAFSSSGGGGGGAGGGGAGGGGGGGGGGAS
jgi:uncharacterized membrane protein YgcG